MILLGMLHAKETGISSCCLGLWLVYTFTFLLFTPLGSIVVCSMVQFDNFLQELLVYSLQLFFRTQTHNGRT